MTKVKLFPICDCVTNTSTIRGVQSLSKKNIGNMLKNLFINDFINSTICKTTSYTSDTVNSKLLNPLPEDPKTNIEAPKEE